MHMARYYAESLEVYKDVHPIADEAELVKEVAAKVAQVCGDWTCARLPADIGVCLLAAKVLFNLPSADLINNNRCTLLGPAPCEEEPRVAGGKLPQ